jgi:hypothetical protein
LNKYADLLNYFQELPFLERYNAGKFLGAVRVELNAGIGNKDPWGSAGPRHAGQLLRPLHERLIDPHGKKAPVHKGHWPSIGLATIEEPHAKREIALSRPDLTGPILNRLRSSEDLSWYNAVVP